MKRLTRRDFLKLLGVGALDAFGLFAGAALYSVFIEPQWVDVAEVPLQLPRLGKNFAGLRVAQLSDIHMGGWMDRERFDNAVDLTLEAKPDLLLITGDFLWGHDFTSDIVVALDDLRLTLSRLSEAMPVFAVLGNHDHWISADAMRAVFKDTNVVDLTNSVHTLTRGDDSLHIVGADDAWQTRPDLNSIIAQVPENGAAILLEHEPDYADKSSATGRFDLQVSGHTHGGQISIPFYGAPVLPYMGRKYPSGLYKVRDMWQYTNRGIGMVRPFVRFNCRAEITIFTLLAQS